MKIFLAVILLIGQYTCAQTTIPTSAYNYRDTEATITTNKNSKIYIEKIALVGSDVRFILNSTKMRSATDSNTSNAISISDIKKIKIKRDAFFTGAAVGVVPGYFLGYGVGWASYDEKTHWTDERNDEKRKEKGLLFGLIGAVPTGIVGGIFSTVFAKKTYRIKGDRSKMERVFEKKL